MHEAFGSLFKSFHCEMLKSTLKCILLSTLFAAGLREAEASAIEIPWMIFCVRVGALFYQVLQITCMHRDRNGSTEGAGKQQHSRVLCYQHLATKWRRRLQLKIAAEQHGHQAAL